MTTILKSNSTAKNYITSATKLTLPTDYMAALDFVKEMYRFANTSKSLTDMITLTRGYAAGCIDKNGNYVDVGVNVPRLHNDPIVGKGLLVENAYTNFLPNPTTPIAQTVTTNVGAGAWLMVQVWGTGNCQVEVRNSSDVVITVGTATENLPFLWYASTALSGAKITVVPTNITHYQANTNNSPRKNQTKIKGLNTIHSDQVLFNKTMLADILATRGELSIVIRKSDIADSVTNIATNTRTQNILQIAEETGDKGVFVGAKRGASKKGALRVMQTAETIVDNIDSVRDEVYVLVISSDVAKLWQNGTATTIAITGLLALTQLYLASGKIWSSTVIGNMNQIIKEVYIYDRKLTDTELAAIAY